MIQPGCQAKYSPIRVLFFGVILLLSSRVSSANSSAVILQYHHISADTPSSTSVSPDQFEKHLQWLRTNNFEILPLQKVVATLKKGRVFESDKVVSITFDDANISVCDTAWPILKRKKIPFTIFIHTDPVNKKFQSQCSWEALRKMTESGLVTPANHSVNHLNMVSFGEVNKPNWKTKMAAEITLAQQAIFDNLGAEYKLFAYPYGEYNTKLAALLYELAYTGFGQHSGAVGHHSDFLALPRFPASGHHANLSTLQTKLLSLPFPAEISYSAENPILESGRDNPPELVIRPINKAILKSINCFTRDGKLVPTTTEGNKIIVKAKEKFVAGRHLYTCTSKSPIANRYYWISHQWLVE